MELDKKSKRSIANVNAYKSVFLKTAEGKKVLWDLMRECGMLRNGFVPNDPYTTCYNEGGRQVALHILNKVGTDIQNLEKMIRENLEEEQRVGGGLDV